MEDVPYACPSASSHTAFEENADQMDNDDDYTYICQWLEQASYINWAVLMNT